MLWILFAVLLVLWVVGFIGFHILGGWVHVLLLVALIVLLIRLLSGRRAA